MTPQTRYQIAFWTVTAPIVPYATLILLLVLILSWTPGTLARRIDRRIDRHMIALTAWRDNIPWVKRTRDRAYLFDYMKSFE